LARRAQRSGLRDQKARAERDRLAELAYAEADTWARTGLLGSIDARGGERAAAWIAERRERAPKNVGNDDFGGSQA
jgi:hypothetical protein